MIERFWLFHCAYASVPRAVLIGDGGWQKVRMPFLAGVAEHDEHGLILLDAPYGREGPSNVGAVVGSLLEYGGLVFEERWAVVPRIEELGLRSADVQDVLMTHLHCDHTGGMKTVAHARFHLSEREWEFAHQGSSKLAATRGYARSDFEALDHQIVTHEPMPHLADSERGLDVLGDGSIEMFFLPGHTPGHCGYRIHLEEGPNIFFAGDAAFTVPQIFGEQKPGLLPDNVATSSGGVDVSLRALRKHLEQSGDIPVVCHDLELGARCIDEGPIAFGD